MGFKGSGGDEIPDHWRPYGNDIVGEDEDEIVILETQDGEKIKETGKYDTRSENQDYDLTKQYLDEEDENEEEEEVDNYGDYNPDYENEGSGRQSGDYGQYYDYNYEGSGGDYKQNTVSDDDSEYAEDNTDDDPMIEEEQQQKDPEIAEEQHAEGLATTDSPATNDDSLETNETEAQTNEGAKEDYDDSDDDYKEPEEKNVEQEDYEEEEEDDGQDASERERIETEEELLYRNYEILSDFYKKHFVDLRVLDTSCVPEKVPPPSIANGGVKEYQTVENVLLPGKRYHEVVYQCDPGYKLSDSSLGHMFCQQQGWMGVQPYCEEDPNAQFSSIPNALKDCPENNGCEHLCKLVNGKPECFCNEGYEIYDVTSCSDIDECADGNGGCSHACINKPGTYTCKFSSFEFTLIVDMMLSFFFLCR